MIYVSDCTNITMWFISVKLSFDIYFFLTFFNFNFGAGKGIEPLHPAWKASVLPLNYTRNIQTIALFIIKFLSLVEGEIELSKTEVNGFTARPI